MVMNTTNGNGWCNKRRHLTSQHEIEMYPPLPKIVPKILISVQQFVLPLIDKRI